MFALTMRPMFRHIRTQRIGLIKIKRDFSLKFLRDKQLKKELKLQSIQELVLKRNCETNGDFNWNELVTEMIDQKLVYKQNFEMDLMSAFLLNEGKDCHKLNQKLFKSLVGFVKQLPNIESNRIAVSRYCHFVSHFHQFIDKSDIDLIRQTTDHLMDKYIENKITNQVIIDCITALTQSSKDNCLHSIQLLDRLNTTNSKLIEQIIDSSIRFELFEQTFDLINRYSGFGLDMELISKVIDSLIDSNLSFDKTIQLFKTFSQNLFVFDKKSKPILIEILNKFSYKSIDSFVGRNGLCLKCEQTLKGLSAEEQNCLVKEFRSVAFNPENDIMTSFPEYKRELKNFNNFMQKLTANKPLDLVIDGLNVAFSVNPEIVEDETKLRKFVQKYKTENIDKNVIEILVRNKVLENHKNVLIVGRRHMKKWNHLNQLLTNRFDRINMFYTMNKTQDDCYALLSAIVSNTHLVSNDLYRDYCDKMSKNSLLFRRWLRTHQVLFRKKSFEFPDQFDHKIHISADNRIIHIPFGNSDELKVNWICFKKYE